MTSSDILPFAMERFWIPLGGQLKKLSFYLLEDHSGTDEKFDAF